MKTCGLLLAAALMLSGGCVVHPKGTCGPACPAIEAATTIGLASERLPVLERIAAQENLSEHEQTYLVNAVCHGGFSGDQADALITLIKNPCCTHETRQYISKKLRFIMFSNDRRRVVEALIEHSGGGEQSAE
ncbi:MAG: hypothetical protein KAY37_17845 [Phycisphaerae bacterium]|nr:hypothetical protein [Phycisphaerae bacterium]